MNRSLVAAAAAFSVAALSLPALAGGSGTSSSACGSTSAGWNVPNGAVVFSRGEGPVREVVSSAGEYRSHVMLSHGPNGWMSHAAMFTPGTADVCEACDNPARWAELQDGYPGAAQISQGATYSYIYNNGANEYLRYQRGTPSANPTAGEAIANWLWNSMPYQWVTSKKDSSQGLYRLKFDNGQYVKYSLHQFRNLDGINEGRNPASNGVICSSFISYAQSRGLGASFNMAPYTYDATRTATGLNMLKDSVQSACGSSLGFWSGLGAGVSCFFCDLDTNVCDDAGRQVARCMKDGDGYCKKGGDSFSTGGVTATTISPDRVGGWNGHPYSGSGVAGSGVSAWSYDSSNGVQWNSGGNNYSCWF